MTQVLLDTYWPTAVNPSELHLWVLCILAPLAVGVVFMAIGFAKRLNSPDEFAGEADSVVFTAEEERRELERIRNLTPLGRELAAQELQASADAQEPQPALH